MATATHDWELWSTSCRLVVTDPRRLAEAARLVDADLAAVELACSRFRADSELMTLQRSADGSARVSPMLRELLDVAIDAARDTDGAVDPTVGSLLVGIGYDRDIARVRRGEGRVRLVPRPGDWRTLRLAGDHLSMPPGTQLDLGATAKAHAADRCARRVAEELGIGVLVSLGGDIATAGPSPLPTGWQVTVRDLPSDPAQQVTLSPGAAIATSSTARRRWVQDGVVHHHVIDPSTARPAAGPWRSVSVVAPTALRANVAATAALVRGDAALTLLRRTTLPARLVAHTGSVTTLNGWPREQVAA